MPPRGPARSVATIEARRRVVRRAMPGALRARRPARSRGWRSPRKRGHLRQPPVHDRRWHDQRDQERGNARRRPAFRDLRRRFRRRARIHGRRRPLCVIGGERPHARAGDRAGKAGIAARAASRDRLQGDARIVRAVHQIQRQLSMQSAELTNYIYKLHGRY